MQLNKQIRCPEYGCYGWAVDISDISDQLLGCGMCGTTWQVDSDIQKSISSIVQQFAYRKSVYNKINNQWVAVDLSEEPQDYAELVKNNEPL